MLHLKPLSQAQISKEVGEHESTISRILKNKSLEMPEGVFQLKFFCQSKGDVVKRIIKIREAQELASGNRTEPFSDGEISEILEKDYKAKVSRRTVTYHRNKMTEAPKFLQGFIKKPHFVISRSQVMVGSGIVGIISDSSFVGVDRIFIDHGFSVKITQIALIPGIRVV